jgi:hypothetical protein
MVRGSGGNTKPGTTSIDLLKIPVSKDRANFYVTTLTQNLYTMEELAALDPGETHNDDRYKLIQGNIV